MAGRFNQDSHAQKSDPVVCCKLERIERDTHELRQDKDMLLREIQILHRTVSDVTRGRGTCTAAAAAVATS